MTTDQKGAVAEAAIVLAALRLGIGVYKPISDGERYDLILDLRPRLLRVQCKSATRKGDVVTVPCYSARRSRDGFIKRAYTADEVDAIAAYCSELDRCYVLPPDLFSGQAHVCLRLEPTRNDQRLRVNWADQFDFGARLPTVLGP